MEYNEKKGKFTFSKEDHKLFKKIAQIQEAQFQYAKEKTLYILNNKIIDKHEIENALDLLFDFLGNEDALLLYRQLCRYYSNIDPKATLDYINFYIEEYDPNRKRFGNKGKNNTKQDREDR